MRLALYQPDIPQNTGTLLRLAACFGLSVDLIEPCGFIFDDRRLRRSGMDYLAAVDLTRHSSWEAYCQTRSRLHVPGGRLILLTTRASMPYTGFAFKAGDSLMVGSESSGVPPSVHEAADARVKIPMRGGFRSLNVAVAAAMVIGEALRQTGFPAPATTSTGTTEEHGS
ncbi:tRNA (cytidine(34)-2'-O)-methyltransferase [Dongia soli]|uniref:tRNA (cytidine(34)-2'-O)-methyltransferase n=1 Tax=Dongia soli TaxID=600628 RepID=A0ABU5EEL1_9PROT|nr:tRNA (cytidine(34)-2'-O)-methyltransferase [Dongia soli]MDY0883908.1 tRNA (cytidine(34)-2'-O)-methyltransferase [Dongia soli]